jgi:hypothetical protein
MAGIRKVYLRAVWLSEIPDGLPAQILAQLLERLKTEGSYFLGCSAGAGVRVFYNAEEKVFLLRKVVLQAALEHANRVCNLLDGHGRISLSFHNLDGSLENFTVPVSPFYHAT